MITLVDWYLEETTWGYVLNHPQMPDGMHVHTSAIKNIKLSESGDSLLIQTRSGNEYELKLSEIDLEKFEKTQDRLKEFNISTVTKEKCQKLKELAEDELLSKVDKILSDSELYLLQYGVTTRCAYFKNNEGIIHKQFVNCHVGMFQESFLIRGREHEVDFRYFPNSGGIKPYHCSEGLKAIKIENLGKYDLKFCADTEIICKTGEITTIESEQYCGEGLISPDSVNGKCALTGGADDE